MAEDGRQQVPYGSGAWWSSRTDDELRKAIEGNYPGGLAHDAPMAELQRRDAARERKRQLRWIKLTFWATVGLGAVGLIATLVFG